MTGPASATNAGAVDNASTASDSPTSGAAEASVNPSYNWIYKQLVTDSNDAVGAFAYVLYKQEKIAFIEAIKATHDREPTAEELRTFHTQTCTPPRIESYLKSAELLAQEFLNAGLKEHLEQFESEIRESVLSKNLEAITTELHSKKSWLQWGRDIVGNLGVNIATIVFVGAALGGYQAINKFNSNVEKMANYPSAEASPAPPLPGSAPATDAKSAASKSTVQKHLDSSADRNASAS